MVNQNRGGRDGQGKNTNTSGADRVFFVSDKMRKIK